jgi:peptide/nickel transport system permease protein
MEQRIFKRFARNKLALLGLAIISTFVAVAIFGPWYVGDWGLAIDLTNDLRGPDAGRLGYGENGVDVLTWLVHGARISLFVSVVATLVSLTIGVSYGAISGFFGKRIDALMMRVVDVLLAFPGLLLAIYIAAVLTPSIVNVVIALCATGWVGYARLARAQVLAVKNLDYVIAAQSLGAKRKRVIFVHILPNILGPLIVQASFGFSCSDSTSWAMVYAMCLT